MSPACTFTGKKDGAGKTGYSNNFGEPEGGGQNVATQIIFQLLKFLVSRFTESRKEMQGHENIVSTVFIYKLKLIYSNPLLCSHPELRPVSEKGQLNIIFLSILPLNEGQPCGGHQIWKCGYITGNLPIC